MRLKTRSALGTFSKGNAYSLSLNFGVSGGRHCDASCSHHPQSTASDATGDCYAVRSELRHDRAQLAAKLERHELLPPSRTIGKAILELQDLIRRGKRVDWLRISTNGSVPQWNGPGCTSLFKSQFLALLRLCKANGIKIHFPVETAEKAEGYRSLIGDLAVVRESVQDLEQFVNSAEAVSTSAGAGLRLLDRVALCRQIAKRRIVAVGRKTIVCPAVTSTIRKKLERDPARKGQREAAAECSKCGTCTACSMPHVDILYPAH